MRRFAIRSIRAVKLIAKDGSIPRPLRGLVVLGLLPIPGPVDEAVLLVVGAFLWAFYSDRMRAAWHAAGSAPAAAQVALPLEVARDAEGFRR